MTDLRTAAQQALEALEGGADSWQLIGPAIDALKAALADGDKVAPTDPVQEPLKDEEIKKLLIESAGMTVVFSEVDLRFARAIERAHGIGDNT